MIDILIALTVLVVTVLIGIPLFILLIRYGSWVWDKIDP